jgi:hypothetical protein
MSGAKSHFKSRRNVLKVSAKDMPLSEYKFNSMIKEVEDRIKSNV